MKLYRLKLWFVYRTKNVSRKLKFQAWEGGERSLPNLDWPWPSSPIHRRRRFSGDGATLTDDVFEKVKKKPPTFLFFFFSLAVNGGTEGGVSTTPCDVITPTKFLSRLSRQLYLYIAFMKRTSDIYVYIYTCGGKSSKIAQQLVQREKSEKRENSKSNKFFIRKNGTKAIGVWSNVEKEKKKKHPV